MGAVDTIINICNDFKQQRFGIEELQSRLRTIVIEDDIKQYLDKVLSDADNELEEIGFCYLDTNHYLCGLDVTMSLIDKIKEMEEEKSCHKL